MPQRSPLRRAPRYPMVFPVSYQLQTPQAGPARCCYTRSLSTTGACLELYEQLPPGASLSLRIQTDQECLAATAGVVWVEPLTPPGEAIQHGVAFTQLLSVQQEVLGGIIRRHARVWAPVRVQLSLPVRCFATTAAPSLLAGWTADLGREGLALDLPEHLSIGTPVAITLAAPRGEVTATATIVWADPVPGGRCIRHGLLLTHPGSVWDMLSRFQSGRKESEVADSPVAVA